MRILLGRKVVQLTDWRVVMSSINKPKPQSKKWQRKQADRERSKKQRKAKAKAASDASISPPEQVRLVPAPHARALRCRVERK